MHTLIPPHRIVGSNALSAAKATLAQQGNARSLLLICDANSWQAAGEQAMQHLADGYAITVHSLDKRATASLNAAQTLAKEANAHDLLIALGSGTINDITKYAAFLAHKPYICIATAASMNGYLSANASLEHQGFKTSFAATPPRAIIADTTILAAAPKRMTRAGLGDTLCRSTVEADMLLSHHLLGTPYPQQLFAKMRVHEEALLRTASTLRDGDERFVSTLIHALLDAGDTMTEYGSSAVASQGEHMIAHTLEMISGKELGDLLHGELIAVTTHSMNHLQHKMLLGAPSVRVMPTEHEKIARLFGKKNIKKLQQDYAKKLLTPEQAEAINGKLHHDWPAIKTTLQAIMLPIHTLHRALVHSGLAHTANGLSIDEERYRFACTYAHLTRDRFGFLDLATMNDKRIS